MTFSGIMTTAQITTDCVFGRLPRNCRKQFRSDVRSTAREQAHRGRRRLSEEAGSPRGRLDLSSEFSSETLRKGVNRHEGERRRSSGRSCLSREAASSAGPDDASRNEAPRNMPGAFFLSSFFRDRKKEDIQSKHFQNIRNRTLKNSRSGPRW